LVAFEWDDDPLVTGRRYNELWSKLLDLFDRHGDLIEVTTIKNSYLADAIDETQQLLYAA
jgi:hypothetical protein